MNDNEISLTASYYHLFRTRTRQNNETNDHPPVIEYTAAANGFWDEDEWTPEEEEQAERLLQDAREKCSIRDSHGLMGAFSTNTAAVSNGGIFQAASSSTATTTSNNNIHNKEDEQAWNKFYSQHQTNFFKDRHYLHKAFPEEFCHPPPQTHTPFNSGVQQRTLVEVGCGVGNLLLPLLEDTIDAIDQDDRNEFQWTVHGLDLSKVAIEMMQQDERFQRAAAQGRATAHVYDISSSSTRAIPRSLFECAHVTTLLFCLSAIAPGPCMVQAVCNVAATLKPGSGVLVFRDYGRYDEAQLKLGTSRNKLLEDNFYRKHDGTKCYYFTLEDVRELFVKHGGLQILELKYLKRIYRNRGTNEVRRRVWVQGRFQKNLKAMEAKNKVT